MTNKTTDTKITFKQAENIAWLLNTAMDEIQEEFYDITDPCYIAEDDTLLFFDKYGYQIYDDTMPDKEELPGNLELRINNIIKEYTKEYQDVKITKEIQDLIHEKENIVNFEIRQGKYIGDPLSGTTRWLECHNDKDEDRATEIEYKLIEIVEEVETDARQRINAKANSVVSNCFEETQKTYLKIMKEAVIDTVYRLTENDIAITEIVAGNHKNLAYYTPLYTPEYHTPEGTVMDNPTYNEILSATDLYIPTVYITANNNQEKSTDDKNDLMVILYNKDRYKEGPLLKSIIDQEENKVVLSIPTDKDKAVFNHFETQLAILAENYIPPAKTEIEPDQSMSR